MQGVKLAGIGLVAFAVMASVGPMAMADTGSTGASGTTSATGTSSTSGTTWHVTVGPMSQDGIMAMAFFPNVLTIDAGDSVTFTGTGHTVTFPGADGKLPASTSPAAQMPAGGSTYDGSTFTSSGLLTGKPYTLQFTKPGVYPYYCLLHPGMMGVVIVNPAGTAYPMTQAQYDAQSQQQEQADFSAGEKAVASFHLKTKHNANGTTTYYAQTDAPEPQAVSFQLKAAGGSSATGNALIAFALPPSSSDPNITYRITAKLTGLTPGQSYSAVLSEGESGSGTAVPGSSFQKITVNSDGTATVTGSVQASGLPQGIWNLDIEDASHQVVATGLIDNPSFAYERFLPKTLTIHPGDQVVWTQTGVNEVHTVTFLPKGWSDIPNESLMPVPYGGHIYAGTGYFNSGFMVPGSTYTLTFLQSGDFAYRCLLHDVMGMYGEVDVVPQPGVSTFALDNTVLDVPSFVRGGTTYVPLWSVEQLLKANGIHSSWNGRDWKVTAPHGVHTAGWTKGSGNDNLYIDGHLVGRTAGIVKAWPGTHIATTFVSIDAVRAALSAIGLSGSWNGSTWDATPQAHAGSVPSVPAGAGSSSTTGSASNGSASTGSDMSGMPGM